MVITMEPIGTNQEGQEDSKQSDIAKLEAKKNDLRDSMESAPDEKSRTEIRQQLISIDLQLVPLEFTDKNEKGEEVQLPGYKEAMIGVYKRAMGQFLDQLGRFDIDIARAKAKKIDTRDLEARKKALENQSSVYEFAKRKLEVSLAQEQVNEQQQAELTGTELEKAQQSLNQLRNEKAVLEKQKSYYSDHIDFLEGLVLQGGTDPKGFIGKDQQELARLDQEIANQDKKIKKAEEDLNFEKTLRGA